MSLSGRARNFFGLLLRKQKMEDDLEAELRSYLAMLTDRHVERGLPLEEAQRAARIELEGLEQVKEQVREVRVGATFESWLQDIRYAVRSLGKSPGFDPGARSGRQHRDLQCILRRSAAAASLRPA